MKVVSIFTAKTHLSGLINEITQLHEEVIITRRGQQVAKIIPMLPQRNRGLAEVVRDIKKLRQEIGKTGITLKDIKAMKEQGRA